MFKSFEEFISESNKLNESFFFQRKGAGLIFKSDGKKNWYTVKGERQNSKLYRPSFSEKDLIAFLKIKSGDSKKLKDLAKNTVTVTKLPKYEHTFKVTTWENGGEFYITLVKSK